MYDGRANTDPRVNSNGLHGIFVLAALKPEPKEVLVIGLSSGAWVRILTGFPGVERIQVVDINPGYLDLIRDYPEISPFLKDPRVHVYMDDECRRLKRQADQRFDLIVMNMTFHWRSYTTNLLSREFLELARDHLNPGGVMTYNATGSPDALRTAEAVFPFAYRYANFVVASDEDFRFRTRTGGAQLARLTLDGKPIFDPTDPRDQEFIRRTLAEPFSSSRDDRAGVGRDAEVITDWNMMSELKYGHSFP